MKNFVGFAILVLVVSMVACGETKLADVMKCIGAVPDDSKTTTILTGCNWNADADGAVKCFVDDAIVSCRWEEVELGRDLVLVCTKIPPSGR